MDGKLETTHFSVTMCPNFPVELYATMLTAARDGSAGVKATKRIKWLARDALRVCSLSGPVVNDRSSPEGFSFQTFHRDSAKVGLEEFGNCTRMDVAILRDLAESFFDFVPHELRHNDDAYEPLK